MSRIDQKTLTFQHNFDDRVMRNIWTYNLQPANDYIKLSLEEIIKNTIETFLIITDVEIPNEVLDELMKLYSKNIRLYIISNKAYKNMSLLSGKAHIRISPKIKGKYYLIDHNNSNKGLYLGTKENLTHVSENATILKAFYRYFTYMFWNKCQTMIIGDDYREIDKSNIPIDIIPSTSFQEFYYSTEEIISARNDFSKIISSAKSSLTIYSNSYTKLNNLVYLGNILSEEVKIVIVSSKLDYDSNVIEYIKKRNIELVMVDDLPYEYLVIDKTRTLIAPLEFNEILNENSFISFISALDSSIEKYTVKDSIFSGIYIDDIELGNIKSDSLIINDQKIDILCCQEQEYTINDVRLENLICNEFDKNEIIQKGYASENVIKNINYSIELKPEALGLNAKPDKLYENWTKFGEVYYKSLEYLKSELEKNEISRSDNIKDIIFDKLKQVFASKGVNYNKTKKKIEKQIKYYEAGRFTKEDMNKYFDELLILRAEINGDREDLANVIEENKQRIEYDKKEKASSDRINNRENELRIVLTQLSSYKNENLNMQNVKNTINDYKNNLPIIKEQINDFKNKDDEEFDDFKNLDRINKEIKSILFNDKISNSNRNKLDQLVQRLSDLYGKYDFLIYDLNKDSVNYSGLVEYNEKVLDEGFYTKTQNSLIKNFVDLTSQEAIIDDYIKNNLGLVKDYNKKLNNFESTIKQKQIEIEKMRELHSKQFERFTFDKITLDRIDDSLQGIVSKKSNKKKKNNGGQSEAPFITEKDIPEENLPKVGKLYVFKNERCLAISDWDEYDKALIECSRLKARIIAEGGNNERV